MRKFSRTFWQSGLGSEIFSMAIMLAGMGIMAAIVVWFSTYDAAIQSQTVADAVTDGAVAYAQNDMNIAEEPFEIMVGKIYEANQALSGGSGRIRIDNLAWQIESAGDHPEVFQPAEWNYIRTRATTANGSGVLSTYHFNFYRDMPDYPVRYAGPRYMDQLVTVTIDASMDIPFASLFTKTGKAVTLTLAKDPYNGRADQSANSGLYSYMKELEQVAYSEILLPEEEQAFSSADVPGHGSLVQKVILEARRYLGDGYARDSRIHSEPTFWPRLNRDGTETVFLPYSGGANSYKDCYQFVNACFKVDQMSGLTEAQARYDTTVIRRTVNYERVISAAAIWRELYDDEAYTLTLETDPSKYTGYFATYNKPWYGHGFMLYFLLPNGSVRSCSQRNFQIKWLNSSQTRVKIYKRLPDYEDVRDTYVGESGRTHCFRVNAAESWTTADLQVGDVLVFTDPNFNKNMRNELEIIKNAPSADDPSIQALDNMTGKAYICHYAIYIGNGRIVECSGVDGECPDAADNGVRIRDARNIVWSGDPYDTDLLREIIRFGEKYKTTDEIMEKVSSGEIEEPDLPY